MRPQLRDLSRAARPGDLLKFEQSEPLGRWFAERLAEVVESERDRLAADVIVPVPLHRQRQRKRGYNQAALISKPLAKRLRLPDKKLLLMRTKARPDKRILSRRTLGVGTWRFCDASGQPS